jgi:hypothetical protein
MPTVIKMRCSRVSEFDSGGQNLRELQLVGTDRDGAQLDPANVVFANLSGNFIDPFAAEIEHDALVDVTITISAPAAAAAKK